jgi:hypothetical protein
MRINLIMQGNEQPREAGMIGKTKILELCMMRTIALIAIPFLLASQGTGTRAEGENIKYRTFGTGVFRSFVKSWDDTKHPVLYALIRNTIEWDAMFHPAPVMGHYRPFGPERTVFQKEQILLVAKVTPDSLQTK